MAATDLMSSGFGLPWGQTRSWTNQLTQDSQFGNGMNWTSRELPYLGEADDGTVFVVLGFSSVRFFAPVGGDDYTPLYGARDTLVYSDTNDTFTLITRTGTQWEFFGLDTPGAPSGRLKSYKTPGGIEITLTYAGQQLTQASRSFESGPMETTTLKFVYQYLGGGDPNAGLLERITLRRQVDSDPDIDVKRVLYSYHTGATAYGNLGDLKQVQVERWDGSSWLLYSGNYYRYYKDAAGGIGFEHGLRYELGADALLRMLLALSITNPDDATNTQVAQYADHYFEYDPTTRRATKETIDAGSRTFTFSYTERTSTPTEDFNVWQMKTVETRPTGGGEVTVYTNYIGQVLLRQLRDGSQFWYDHSTYDSDGRLIQHANPSAVIGYNDTDPSLDVDLRTDEGLIRVYAYYATDTSPAAQGYLEYEAIKQGTGGDEVVLREYEYGTQTEGDITVRPVIQETVYRNDNGTGAIATAYDYEYFTGTVRVMQRITTLPAVPTSQNGGNTTAERWEYFDEFGNMTFVQDERGYITAHQFDPITQSQTRTIEDADDDLPSGWSALPGAHLNLVTDYVVDDEGRTVEMLGPEHDVDGEVVRTATWTVYKDLVLRSDDIAPGIFHEVWSTQGYFADSTYQVTDPPLAVSITRIDAAERRVAQILSTRDPEAGAKLSPDEDYSDPARWLRCSVNLFDDQSQLTDMRVYHDIPSSGTGSEGTNYDTTRYLYDAMDRQDGMRSPGGTITRTTFDVRGLPLEQWVGTNDNGFAATNFDSSGSSDLVQVSSQTYDGGSDGGDGNLTELRLPVDSTSGNDRVTTYGYDWRNRQETIAAPENAYFINVYDNLDRVIQADRKNGSGGNLVGRSTTDFDERGQVYKSTRYAVNPTNGAVGNALVDKSWYDASGNVIKQFPSGSWAFTKMMYDGVGRTVNQYLAWDSSEADTDYAAAGSVAGNTVMEQSETTYDDAGNVAFTKSLRRIDSATGTGALNLPAGSQPRGRPSYQGFWHDVVGRQYATADWGTNGGSDPTRPSSPPSSSDTIHVTTTFYDDAGQVGLMIDPSGTYTYLQYDNAGRLVLQYDNFQISGSDDDVNRLTTFEFNADGVLKKLTAHNSTTGNQVTEYVYGVATTGGDSSLVARQDLLKAVIYPDSVDADDRVQYRYNRQGDVSELKDQAETVHAYEYDKLARLTEDKVTLPGGSAVDGAVKRIQRQYNSRGLPFLVTSHSAASGGSVVNQVRFDYNNFGQLQTDYQDHSAIVTGGSLYVNYGYADGSDNHVRRNYMVYPSTRIVRFAYGASSTNDYRLSRPAGVTDSSGGLTYAGYTYLGARSVVKVDYTEPDVRYNLATGGGNDPYDGLDRFDRVTSAYWRYYGGTPKDLVKIDYTYDRVSSRITRDDVIAKAQTTPVYQDEKYGYDGLDRLKTLDRGELSGGSITNKQFAQDWHLDPTGNWKTFKQDDDGGGTWDLDQSRTHNPVNEITGITGGSWIVPVHDRTGNLTTMPRPKSLTNPYYGTYDAWNRLVKITDGTDTIAEYAYDGLNRRTVKKTYVSGSLTETRDFFYSDQWQVIEERVATTVVKQFIWGLRYIDDLILRDRDIGLGSLTERLYACQDANFNVVAIVDDTGDVKERFAFQPYGESEELDPDFSSYSGTDYQWEYRFTGRELDLNTGLQINRMRYLHLQLGRWITRDDIGYLDGMNLYLARVAIQTTDPTGRKQYVPGQATCKKTVKGMGATPQNVYYVPRGFFKLVSVGQYMSGNEDLVSRIGSDAFILWKPNATSEFIDGKGCCCCDKVGFLQTVAKTTKYSGAGQPVNQQSSWTIDDGIPYPYSTTVNPCAGATQIELRDSPNAPESYRGIGRMLRAERQDFVTCAVCLEGTERYTWNAWLEYGDLPGNWRINEIVVYGCVRWGHSIHWSDADGKYKYQRYADGESRQGNSKVQINLTDFGGTAPNANWKEGVLRRQGW